MTQGFLISLPTPLSTFQYRIQNAQGDNLIVKNQWLNFWLCPGYSENFIQPQFLHF